MRIGFSSENQYSHASCVGVQGIGDDVTNLPQRISMRQNQANSSRLTFREEMPSFFFLLEYSSSCLYSAIDGECCNKYWRIAFSSWLPSLLSLKKKHFHRLMYCIGSFENRFVYAVAPAMNVWVPMFILAHVPLFFLSSNTHAAWYKCQ